MKKKIFIIVGIVLFTVCGLAYCANGPWPVNFELAVTDGEGNPVADAEVRISSTIYKNWENERTERIEGKSDSKGQYNITIKTAYAFAGRVKKEGYYERQIDDIYYQRELEQQGKERGAPITVKRELIMRKVLNPVPLVISSKRYLMYVVDKKQGFDLEKMDWVAPYGEGKKTDFYFEQKGFRGDNGYDTTLTISFPNKGDGIVAYDPDTEEWRFAPEGGYIFDYKWSFKNDYNKSSAANVDELKQNQKDYFLRVRSVVDSDGKVVTANYAKISLDSLDPFIVGEGLDNGFQYGRFGLRFSFNPEANSRSMESGKGTIFMRDN